MTAAGAGARTAPRPDAVVLDVNETLSDVSGLRSTFTELGLDPASVDVWFAGVLRDAFALTVLGDNPSFADIARSSIAAAVTTAGSLLDPEDAEDRLMAAFTGLRPHPDVVPGLLTLARAGCRVVTLSNGSAAVARGLLEHTAAAGVVEAYLSVQDAAAWKPAPAAYAHALRHLGVPPGAAMLVAVHPWDIEGARRAGLRTAWIGRGTATYPRHFGTPELTAASLVELAATFA